MMTKLLREIFITKYKARAYIANAVGLLLSSALVQPRFSKSSLWREIFYCLEGTRSSFQDQAALSGGSLPIGQGNVKGFKPFARLRFELGGKKTLYVEGVFLIKIG